MIAISTMLIGVGLVCAFLLILNEMGINVNVREKPEYTVLFAGRVTASGRVVKNGKSAMYLGDRPLTPGMRVVVAAVA